MRFVVAVILGMVLVLPTGNAAARKPDNPHPPGPKSDGPIAAAPDHAVVSAHAPQVTVSVVAQDVPPAARTRASLIIYGPDGTMVKTLRRTVRGSQANFRISFGGVPAEALRRGTYTVHATVEAGSQAFGMPTSFEITDD